MSKYTLTIRGLESQAEARKIAEDYFGVMMWKHESGCMTCWPQRDEHPLTITDSGADGKVVAGLQAEVRRLRREANDVFECADGTVAKDASVAAQSWADECRRLREEVAKLADQRNEGRELVSALSNEGGAEIARLREREAKAREILQAHADEYERTDTDDGVLRAAERLDIWMSAKRWLETE